MELSLAGKELLEALEGLRLSAYKDSGGVWTNGYGHTKGVKEGDICSIEQAEQWLAEDVAWAVAAVNKGIKTLTSQKQFDALVVFAFNVGEKAFKKSTLLLLHNKQQYVAAALQFPLWCHAGGKIIKGLLIRRFKEALLYLDGC